MSSAAAITTRAELGRHAATTTPAPKEAQQAPTLTIVARACTFIMSLPSCITDCGRRRSMTIYALSINL